MDRNGRRHDETLDCDVLVVGGGLAGLTAAAVAAGEGARVTLLEARSAPGGRARSRQQGGFVLNEGAHALYADGEALAELARLGVRVAGWVPPTAGSLGLAAGATGVLPVDAATMLRTPLLGVRGKIAAGRALAGLARLRPGELVGRSVDDWLLATVDDPAARRLVGAVVRVATYCDAPHHLDAGAAVTQVQRSLRGGVRYVHGGWQRIVDDLADVATARGVTIRTGTKVTAVRRRTGGVVDVELASGATGSAAAVVLAGAGPDRAATLLGDAGAELAEVARRCVPSMVSALDVCLRVPWGDHPRFVLGIDEPLYLSVHGPGADVVPAGGSLVSLLRYLPSGDDDEDGATTRDRLEAMLDGVRPGWRAEVVHARFLRHALVAHDVPGARAGGLAGRPAPGDTGVPGVLVAGDWVGPAGLLSDAAVASGADAGRRAAAIASAARLVA